VFGYAAGGYVRSADEALKWAQAQAGKPYRYPMVGPNSYDCSGFTSALINYILGRNPHSRRHSSGSVRNDPALAPGGGDSANGLLIGARPPYTTNAQGARVGHVAATLMGTNMEATPPAVRVGGAARGALHGMFTELYHLPGFGGLSTEDKSIVSLIKGLLSLKLPAGQPPLGNLLNRAVNTLPGQVYDFLIKKMPSLIVDAVLDVAGKIGGAVWNGIKMVTPFADGGTIGANGPILVGERGPELRWGSRGEFIESTESLRARLAEASARPIQILVYGAERRYVRELVEAIRREELAR
jgi:hypothetical protein